MLKSDQERALGTRNKQYWMTDQRHTFLHKAWTIWMCLCWLEFWQCVIVFPDPRTTEPDELPIPGHGIGNVVLCKAPRFCPVRSLSQDGPAPLLGVYEEYNTWEAEANDQWCLFLCCRHVWSHSFWFLWPRWFQIDECHIQGSLHANYGVETLPDIPNIGAVTSMKW